MKKGLITVLLILIVLGVGCASDNERYTAKATEEKQVGKQQALYVATQPPPYFDWSQQRDIMIQIYKAQNEAIYTYSYTQSPYTGKIMWESATFGFPIAGGTQLTNPEQTVTAYQSLATIAQAEPNGLYSPESSRGTWVLCVNEDGSISPAYIEDDVKCFTTPMKEVDGKMTPIGGSTASIKLNIKK